MSHPARTPRPDVDRYRYTGPELGALLAKVRAELGSEASIVQANKVRTGGVAGFFARESFELVAEADAPPVEPAPHVEPALHIEPARRNERPGNDVSMALLQRAEAISAQERHAARARATADPYDLRERSTPNRFGDVLATQLRQPVPATIALPGVGPEPVSAPAAPLTPEVLVEPIPDPAPAAWDESAAEPIVLGGPLVWAEPRNGSTDGGTDETARIAVVIGELTAAFQVADELRTEDLLAGRTVSGAPIVLTPADPDREPLAALPSGSVGHYVEETARALRAQLATGRPGTTVVIDTALGNRIGPELRGVERLAPCDVNLACRTEDEVGPLLAQLRGHQGRVAFRLIEDDG